MRAISWRISLGSGGRPPRDFQRQYSLKLFRCQRIRTGIDPFYELPRFLRSTDIPASLQPKLLRVLQEQEFERLGSTRTHQADVRLVAATNRDLADMVSRGQFRSDLYYRLNVFPVLLPPLRERREDIPALVSHFVEILGRRMGKQIKHISPETMSALSSYEWPGNIRELQNLIERAVILSNHGVLPNPLPTLGTPGVILSSTAPTLRDSERALILQTLEAVGWVIGGPKGAAATLGLKRTTLIHKMQKLGITRPSLQRSQDSCGPHCGSRTHRRECSKRRRNHLNSWTASP